jgi:hypothetical protein
MLERFEEARSRTQTLTAYTTCEVYFAKFSREKLLKL